MAKYRQVRVVEATQWFKNGDHPEDGTDRFTEGEFKGELLEGKVVRYFRHPAVPGDAVCEGCGSTWHYHGWLDQPGQTGIVFEGMVCPGDFIVTCEDGSYTAVHPAKFLRDYVRLEDGANG